MVELNNKDLFIKDLTDQVEEMKQKISDLNKELAREKTIYEEKLETINDNYEVTLNDLHQRHKHELETIRKLIADIENELGNIKQGQGQLKVDTKTEMAKFKQEIESCHSILQQFGENCKRQLGDKQKEIQTKESEIELLQNRCKEMETNHQKQLENVTKKHSAELQEMEFEMLKSITEMQKKLDIERAKIELIEREKQKEIEQLYQDCKAEQNTLQMQSDAKIKQMEEDFKEANILAEIQMKQRLEDVDISWKMKLHAQQKEAEQILKECQAISEYNIIQCEVEKNHIKAERDEYVKDYENLVVEKNSLMQKYSELQRQFSDLQEQYEVVVRELDETRVKLKEEISRNEEHLQKNICEERAYEITTKQLYGTIEALKNRLLDSDRDVEQLKVELNSCEKSKLEIEDKCNKLQEEVQHLQTLNEELDIQNESSLKITEQKILTVERTLQQKLEDYKSVAEKTITDLENKLRAEQKIAEDALTQLHDQQKASKECHDLIHKTRLELDRLEAVNTESEYKTSRLEAALRRMEKETDKLRISEKHTKDKLTNTEDALKNLTAENETLRLQLENLRSAQAENESNKIQLLQLQKKNEEDVKLRDFYKSKMVEYQTEVEECSGLHKKYIDQSGKYDGLLHKYESLEAKNAELEMKIKEQESLIGPFRDQLKAYEMEHKALLEEKHDAENEAREMGLKYAAILGHQNQKQKIKYLVDLQTKKFELIEVGAYKSTSILYPNAVFLQNKKELESKIRAQSRTIEKLKKEIANLTKGKKVPSASSDKENIGSPNRTLNVSRTESPGGPLKERN